MLKSSALCLLGAVLATYIALPQTAGAAEVVLRVGCGNPSGAITCAAHDRFAQAVEELSKGRIKAVVAYQSLGSEAQLAQSVRSGSVDIGDMSNGNASRFSEAFQLWDLPFLFRDMGAMLDSLNSEIGRSAIKRFERDAKLTFLFPISFGAGRDIQTTKTALRSPKDIKGLKIRAISTPVDQAVFKAWGANPTPVEFGQLFPALQQGVVDGAGLTPSVVLTSNLDAVLKHNLRLNYQALFSISFMNSDKFASLSKEDQRIIVEAAAIASKFNKTSSDERINGDIAKLKALGVDVHQPTSAEYAEWTSIREQVWKQVASEQKGIDLNVARALYANQK